MAARYGGLNCLKYAHGNNSNNSSNRDKCAGKCAVIMYAADHMECLKYLHEENGCEWDSYTIWHAKVLECFKYAVDNGCEWEDGFCANLEKLKLIPQSKL